MTNWTEKLHFDQTHIWHPYAKIPNHTPPLAVTQTQGSIITLNTGQTLVDGMSSWWAALHGYNHPHIQKAMIEQIKTMPHIMFGGLTHEPAIDLAQRLVQLTPTSLQKVFFSDSGSVAMEVAIKMALQYWISLNQPRKNRLLTLKKGYHGDTFATMAICDPDNGMHTLFSDMLTPHFFAPAPQMGFDKASNNEDIYALKTLLERHHTEIAAVTLEPIVQGAGGMRFYRPDYLKQVRALCDQFDTLLIADEIATGFGRTGKLFACEWANICPDIMALGKTLTGGHITLAATLTTEKISETISHGTPGLLMHGPTYMANPLACRAATANIDVLLDSPWQDNVARIEQHLQQTLLPLKRLDGVKDTRVLGAIGVIELESADLGETIQKLAVSQNVWIRPFGKLIYTMPAYNIPTQQLNQLTDGICFAVTQALCLSAQ
ncbi:MAG: adenosylmethionine--8-amino-7-oxononanoate transaminase [Piscirickettsiaceae bacterium CG_4_9_14_3_um_filter_43_564]|nr:adenosylmethionine--8-amino-7-oxononanoate transaminase [Thiomicrospira sp.]OIP93706.1 MAG: adenosylmethionine--8-amino-7-oxononanoate transaminase [Thiomicrospira sp. CG2_30_44_34]PIQ02683.1 MAG: adenosylmethionine--8-amino-7-oxononanoate transaminase [Piscirickettsiaceae bacterium CG18_big_fil_WC_8_21_14_2_50_44_103]PIU38869.1 MAG: adenosylmethionine--8-amino-7-oxononanoate transaminase [Piscirickettsiaceae bacterium CG07_land_8_20_14_0_80_44_28]PIW58044.1 MAG: adenosylmethionine--8-amino-